MSFLGNQVSKKSTAPRSSNRIFNTTQTNKTTIPSRGPSSSQFSSMFNPETCVHRCYLEDFIKLDVGSNITILLPIKECSKAHKVAPTFDSKFLMLIELFEFERTCIGEQTNAFYVINANVTFDHDEMVDVEPMIGLLYRLALACHVLQHWSSLTTKRTDIDDDGVDDDVYSDDGHDLHHIAMLGKVPPKIMIESLASYQVQDNNEASS